MVAPGGITARSMKLQPPASAPASATRQNSIACSPPCACCRVSGSELRLQREKDASPIDTLPTMECCARFVRLQCAGITTCGESLRAYIERVTRPSSVPSKDYARQNRALWTELQAALAQVLVDDDPILGQAVADFEAE